MKKKLVAAILCVVMAGTMTACGSEVSNDSLTVKQYKGLEVAQVAAPEEVTDEYVENTMNSYRGASLETEGTAEDGDTVSLNYVGKVDGVEFEGGKAQGAELELGSGSYIGANGDYKGFEEQVVGHNVGETFDIEVKFPADYPGDVADKVAVFTITINGIYPEITDEWVQKISEESETVEEFKKEIRENIEEYNEEQVEAQLRSEVMEALLEQVEVKKLPEKEIEKEIEQMKEMYMTLAKQSGIEVETFEDCLQYLGTDAETFDKQAQEAAKTAVTRRIACELIADKHNLEPSDKEVKEAEKEFIENSYFESEESFKEVYSDEIIKDTVLQKKVADYLVEKCVQVEAKDTETTE